MTSSTRRPLIEITLHVFVLTLLEHNGIIVLSDVAISFFSYVISELAFAVISRGPPGIPSERALRAGMLGRAAPPVLMRAGSALNAACLSTANKPSAFGKTDFVHL